MPTNKIRIVQLVIVFFVLITIMASAVKSTFESYYGFYHKAGDEKQQLLSRISDGIYNSEPVKVFSSYTGFETGYGFFGPNVSSDFILLYEVYDENKKLITTDNFKLSSREGNMRFTSMNRIFLDKITKKAEPDFNKYVSVVLKQISREIAGNFPGKPTVSLNLYLYDFPSIQQFNKAEKPKLFLINTTLWKS